MKKFKNAIRRSSTMKEPYHRQHTAALPSPPGENRRIFHVNPPMDHGDKLSLSSQDITEIERPLFEKYWDELDPFGIGKVSRPYIITFLESCHLSDGHIQKIIALFEHLSDWERCHVYALLRLVSHIKHGRDINADLTYLPAPSVPVMIEFPINNSYPLYSSYHQPRFRSFSDPAMLADEDPQEIQSTDASVHHQRRSVDDIATGRTIKKSQLFPSSLLLMQSFIPPPSSSFDNNSSFYTSCTNLEPHSTNPINLKVNHLHMPPPPVPSQKTKPTSLLYSKAIGNPKNIFDTPPNYHFCHQQPNIQQNQPLKNKSRPGR